MAEEKQYIVIYHIDWQWSSVGYGEHERLRCHLLQVRARQGTL